MAKFDSDLAEKQLQQAYQEAYKRILGAIQRKEVDNMTLAVFERAMLAEVTVIIRHMDAAAKQWVEQVVPQVYAGASEAAVDAWITADLAPPVAGAGLVGIHQEAVRVIVQNATANFTDANQFVGRRVTDEWRRVSLDAVKRKLTDGETIRQAQKGLAQSIADQGLGGFEDASGATWDVRGYTNMVARTTTREATNLGTTNQLQGMGYDLVRMSTHSGTCAVCAPYQGRVYSLTGATPGYPRLDSVPGFAAGYHTIHPNCRHVVAGYIPELDREVERTQAASNEPFDVDPRSEADRAAYEQEQTDHRHRREDRQQYESYKAWLPDDAPKTFAGFRRMKAVGSDRYRELRSNYREARAQAKAP